MQKTVGGGPARSPLILLSPRFHHDPSCDRGWVFKACPQHFEHGCSRVGGVHMQLGEQKTEIPQTDFLMYFHFSACLLRKMEYNIVRGS